MKFTRFFLLRRLNFLDSTPDNCENRELYLILKDIIIKLPQIELGITFILCNIILLTKPSFSDIELMSAFNLYFYLHVMNIFVFYFYFLSFLEKIPIYLSKYWHTIKICLHISKVLIYTMNYFNTVLFSVTYFNSQESINEKVIKVTFHLVILQFFTFFCLFKLSYFGFKVAFNLFQFCIYIASVILAMIEDESNRKLNEYIQTQIYSSDQSEVEEIEYCIICLGVFVKEEMISILPCSKRHTFHTNCLEKWFSSSLLCPLCRSDLNLKGLNNEELMEELHDIRENFI